MFPKLEVIAILLDRNKLLFVTGFLLTFLVRKIFFKTLILNWFLMLRDGLSAYKTKLRPIHR